MISKISKKPVWILLFSFLIYLIGLGRYSVPLTGDQKVYLSIALEMFQKKEWLIPSLFGEPNFLKPPFQYWMTLMGWKIFGISLIGALLPSVIALLTSSILIFKISKKLQMRNPLAAGLFFASTLGSMTYGTTAQMEIWVVASYLAGWLAAIHSRWWLAFSIIGVLAWIKGPLYSVLWTLSILCWNPRLLKKQRFWSSLLLGTGIGLLWYILAYREHGNEMIAQFFGAENFGKWNTSQGSMLGLWGEFIFSLSPWGLLVIPGFFNSDIRKRWNKNGKFLFWFGFLPLLFFSFFPYRVSSYLYLLTPVFAWMVSEVEFSRTTPSVKILLGVYGLIFSLFSILLFRMNQGGWIQPEILISLVLAFLLFLLALSRREILILAMASLLMVNAIRIAGIEIGERDLQALRQKASDSETRFAYFLDSRDIWHEVGLLSAALQRPILWFSHETETREFMAQGGIMIYQDQQTLPSDQQFQCQEWPRLKRRLKFPLQKLLREGLDRDHQDLKRIFHFCSVRQSF